jgi:hypothetical protein
LLVLAGGAEPLLAFGTGKAKENVGWIGERSSLQLGRPAASRQAQFTVYQWSCAAQGNKRVCIAVVAIRNTTGAPVAWYARLQRLQQHNGTWIEPDLKATTTANGGVDPFAAPLAPGERRFTSLVFQPPDTAALTRLDLREGAFAAGVSLNLN